MKNDGHGTRPLEGQVQRAHHGTTATSRIRVSWLARFNDSVSHAYRPASSHSTCTFVVASQGHRYSS